MGHAEGNILDISVKKGGKEEAHNSEIHLGKYWTIFD